MMHAADLHHSELLDLDPDCGIIRFAGQRALLLDAVAVGLLRNYLVENFGQAAARTVLTQFGFAHGWRMAEAMQSAFPWQHEREWQAAGPRLNALEGLFRLDLDSDGPLSATGLILTASYEAEQQLLHAGRADAPACWTICGLISGYISRSTGHEIYVLEERCTACGASACHMRGKTRAEWGQERASELSFFDATHLRDCLDVSLHRVTETLKAAERKLRGYRRALVRVADDNGEPSGIVARSVPMRKVIDLARRVAKVDSTVLITGESGAGKERIARLVHDESMRSAGPYIAVNCGAIAETLLESELFGHARGAFTGANADRPGLFEAANRGTLLLDEVGEISPAMQVKLLRALQEREIRRVGENRTRPIDVRILAATNRDLAHGVAGGAFRQDLYYRLKVVELVLPPLRQRADDILPLARVLLAESATRMKRKMQGMSPSVADQLLRYAWPGNVRELQNAMERAAALAQGPRVELDDLPEEVRQAPPSALPIRGAVRTLEEVEKEYLLATLALNGGNQTQTARQLGIGSATMYRKLKSYGMIGQT